MVETLRHHARSAAVVTVLLACVWSTACGADGESSSSAERASSSTSMTTTSTPGTSRPPASGTVWDPASLPSCAGLTSFVAPPSWLPDVLTEGAAIEAAGDDVYVSDDPVDPGPERTVYTLAQLAPDGTVLSTFDLTSGGAPLERWVYDSVTGGDEITEVRGQPGSIAHLVNRGDSAGHIDAVWVEDGVQWIARAQNMRMPSDASDSWTVADMATALGSLDLSADSVEDPAGRWVVLGRAPVDETVEARRTLIELGFAIDGVATAPVMIEIRPRPAGATGLSAPTQIAGGPGTRGPGAAGEGMAIAEVDGRAVASSSSTALLELHDGSIATAKVNGAYDIDGQTITPSWDRPDADELVELLRGLNAVAPDDPRLLAVPMPADSGVPVCNGTSWFQPTGAGSSAPSSSAASNS